MSKILKSAPPLAAETARRNRQRGRENRADIELARHEGGDHLLLDRYVIELLPIDAQHPPEDNEREVTPEHVAGVADAIGTLSFAEPLLVADDGEIIQGVIRWEAAKRLGMTKLPCLVLKGLSPEQRRLLRLRLNREQANGTYNFEALRRRFLVLRDRQVNLERTGFSVAERDYVMIGSQLGGMTEEEALPSEGPPVTRLNDLFLLGRHRFLCADALQSSSYVALLGNRQVRMVLSDPPFDRRAETISGSGKIKHGAFVQGSGELGREGFRAFCATFISHMKAHCLPGALVYLYIDWQHLVPMLLAAEDAGLTQKTLGIWDKGRGGQAGGLYRPAHELIPIFATDDTPPVFHVEHGRYGRDRTNIFRYPGATTLGSSARAMLKDHPTPKSVEATIDFMLDASDPEDLILDSFIGSGTLFVAAERANRVGVGLELSPHYCDVSIRRWEKETGEDAILAATGETFAELAKRRLAEPADILAPDDPPVREIVEPEVYAAPAIIDGQHVPTAPALEGFTP